MTPKFRITHSTVHFLLPLQEQVILYDLIIIEIADLSSTKVEQIAGGDVRNLLILQLIDGGISRRNAFRMLYSRRVSCITYQSVSQEQSGQL